VPRLAAHPVTVGPPTGSGPSPTGQGSARRSDGVDTGQCRRALRTAGAMSLTEPLYGKGPPDLCWPSLSLRYLPCRSWRPRARPLPWPSAQLTPADRSTARDLRPQPRRRHLALTSFAMSGPAARRRPQLHVRRLSGALDPDCPHHPGQLRQQRTLNARLHHGHPRTEASAGAGSAPRRCGHGWPSRQVVVRPATSTTSSTKAGRGSA
jgi:hypothetical protein